MHHFQDWGIIQNWEIIDDKRFCHLKISSTEQLNTLLLTGVRKQRSHSTRCIGSTFFFENAQETKLIAAFIYVTWQVDQSRQNIGKIWAKSLTSTKSLQEKIPGKNRIRKIRENSGYKISNIFGQILSMDSIK